MFSCGSKTGLRLIAMDSASRYPTTHLTTQRYFLAKQMNICLAKTKSCAISNIIEQKTHKRNTLMRPILNELNLSSEEAFHYLRDTLGIDSAYTKLRRDPFGLLREITLRSHFRVPFQNVTNTYAIPLAERRIPSFGEIKQAMLTGQGGVCYELNIFTNRLLAALGYSVHLIGGTFMGHDRYHVTNVVHGAGVNCRRHLVEVGASDPTFYPIPLDFEKESPQYQDSFLTYRFQRSQLGNYLQRWHVIRDSDPDISLLDDHAHPTNWRLISEMDIDTDRDLDYFEEPMSYVFNALPRPNLKIFEEGMYAMIYTNGKMTYIRDNHCYTETNDDNVERHVLRSTEEVLEAYMRFIPMIPQEKILMGLNNRNLKFLPPDETKSVTVFPIVRYDNAVKLSETDVA